MQILDAFAKSTSPNVKNWFSRRRGKCWRLLLSAKICLKIIIVPNQNLILDVLTRSNQKVVQNWFFQKILVRKCSKMLILKNQTCCKLMIAKTRDPKMLKVDVIKKTETQTVEIWYTYQHIHNRDVLYTSDLRAKTMKIDAIAEFHRKCSRMMVSETHDLIAQNQMSPTNKHPQKWYSQRTPYFGVNVMGWTGSRHIEKKYRRPTWSEMPVIFLG